MGSDNSGEATFGEHDVTDAGASRRDAIKKAAGAAAVAGTVWAAPRVEGFSLVPSYASASTVFEPIEATGGVQTGPIEVNGIWYQFHTFTEDDELTVISTGSHGNFIEALLVGGGGGGSLGGGAAGRFLLTPQITITQTGAYPVTVGGGGAAGGGPFWLGGSSYAAPAGLLATVGGDGSPSSISSPAPATVLATAAGGGGGGSLPFDDAGTANLAYAVGRDGGSGGGGGFANIPPTRGLSTLVPFSDVNGGVPVPATAPVTNLGSIGGLAPRSTQALVDALPLRAGGGGGAGSAGVGAFNRGSASTPTGSDGGAGASSLGFNGNNVFYAGGGAGSNPTGSTQATGGSGGGGNGFRSTSAVATAGAPNTGGGGGGGQMTGGTASSTVAGAQPGGSGIVIIRYPVLAP